MKRTIALRAASLMAVALLGVACGGGQVDEPESAAESPPPEATSEAVEGTSDGDDTATEPEEKPDAEGPVAGCEDIEVDRDPGSPSPTCEPGSPAPQPLAEETELRVSFGAPSIETNALYLVGMDKGEFEAENLVINNEALPFTDALPLLADGTLALACSGPHASVFNAINQGFNVKWVLNKYWEPEGPYAGLWGRPGMTLEDLEGGTIASAVGASTSSMYPVNDMLETVGLTLADVQVTQIPTTDMVTALDNGAVDAAVVTTPGWLSLMNDDGTTDYEFLGSVVPPGSSVYGCVAGPSILEDNRDAGVALMRAIARTQFTYFAEGWKDDRELLELMASLGDTTVEALEQTPEPVFDWLIYNNATDALQQAYMEADVLEYSEPLPESDVVDQSLMAEALGVQLD